MDGVDVCCVFFLKIVKIREIQGVFMTTLLHVFSSAPRFFGCSMFFQLRSTFFSQTVSVPYTQFEKKCGVVRAPKELLYKLQFFMELLHNGVFMKHPLNL